MNISTTHSRHPNLATLSRFCEFVCELVRSDYSVLVISSGAVSIGCQRLGLASRPKDVVTKQAVAAVGQGRLLRLYDDLFSLLGQPIAQVLLSRENIALEHHYRNALNTFKELLRLGVVPIVNENDTVAVGELRFGDNDTLSALVASLVRAHWLVLLTDVDALYTADPRTNPDAKPIRVVEDIGDLLVDTTGNTAGGTSNSASANPTPATSGKWGTGGMTTKLQAATIATAAGVRTAICSSDRLEDVKRMLQGYTDVGTQFVPYHRAITGHKKWIAQGLRPQGTLIIDDGAAKSILQKHSLFAAGIVAVEGEFAHHSGVKILTTKGKEIARGLTTYGSREIDMIKGLRSSQIVEKLGYHGPEVVIHRGNLVVLPSALSDLDEEMRRGLPRNLSSTSISSLVKEEDSRASSPSPDPAGAKRADTGSLGEAVSSPAASLEKLQKRMEGPASEGADDTSDGEIYGDDVLAE